MIAALLSDLRPAYADALEPNLMFKRSSGARTIQTDGKLLAVGQVGNQFAVSRYLPNGVKDLAFGINGVVITPTGSLGGEASAVAIQKDGKIVVVGRADQETKSDFAVVRYLDNGSLDSSFDGDGMAITPMGNGPSGATAVTLQNDGHIFVAGYSTVATNLDFALVRYQSSGFLDNSFGFLGKVTTDVADASQDVPEQITLTDSGFAVRGYTAGSNLRTITVHYHANGTPALRLGDDGKAPEFVGQARCRESSFQLPAQTAYAVALGRLGQPVMAGNPRGLHEVIGVLSARRLQIETIVHRTENHVWIQRIGIPGAVEPFEIQVPDDSGSKQ